MLKKSDFLLLAEFLELAAYEAKDLIRCDCKYNERSKPGDPLPESWNNDLLRAVQSVCRALSNPDNKKLLHEIMLDMVDMVVEDFAERAIVEQPEELENEFKTALLEFCETNGINPRDIKILKISDLKRKRRGN